MARDGLTADIARGSIWMERDGNDPVRVFGVSAGYVFFESLANGKTAHLHCEAFRARHLAPYDARQFRSQFSMTLNNLPLGFHAYWSWSERRAYYRSNTARPDELRLAARGRPAIPNDAEYVGTYSRSDSHNHDEVVPSGWHRKGLTVFEAFTNDLHALYRRQFRGAVPAL